MFVHFLKAEVLNQGNPSIRSVSETSFVHLFPSGDVNKLPNV